MAINTGEHTRALFLLNRRNDIQGGRVNQSTPRGRFCFRDTNGRMTLPRTTAEADKAFFPVDWAKPLNPGPYFNNGDGLNGAPPYGLSDGSLDAQETDFSLSFNQNYQTPWPMGITQYDIPPMFYNEPVPSGAKALIFDEGTVTYGSGNFVGVASDYNYGTLCEVENSAGNEGKLKVSGGTRKVVAQVVGRDIFGSETVTVRLFGAAKI